MQKSFTIDYLAKRKKLNEGELPMYYVEDNHEAIIPKHLHETVQRLISDKCFYHKNDKLSEKLVFAECGCVYWRFHVHPEYKGGSTAWRCKNNPCHREKKRIANPCHREDERILKRCHREDERIAEEPSS